MYKRVLWNTILFCFNWFLYHLCIVIHRALCLCCSLPLCLIKSETDCCPLTFNKISERALSVRVHRARHDLIKATFQVWHQPELYGAHAIYIHLCCSDVDRFTKWQGNSIDTPVSYTTHHSKFLVIIQINYAMTLA